MKKINEAATRIFSRLLDKLGATDHVQIPSAGFMPLTVERIEQDILTDFGKGELISLCHYYEQNGDLCRDPEMCFIVVDNRQHPKDWAQLQVYPQYYRQDNAGLEEESISIENSRVTKLLKAWQYAHCQFANLWLRNIQNQSYLE